MHSGLERIEDPGHECRQRSRKGEDEKQSPSATHFKKNQHNPHRVQDSKDKMQPCKKLDFANHGADGRAHHTVPHRHNEQKEEGETVACSTKDTCQDEQETGHTSHGNVFVHRLEPEEVDFMVVVIGIEQPFTGPLKYKESNHRRDEVLHGHNLVAVNGAQGKPSDA